MKNILIGLLLISTSVWAEESKLSSTAPKEEKSVENMMKKDKKDRRKKVEMCHDCGKPESVCDCEGEEKEKKEE